jgi:hypothetical protein
MRFLTLGLAGAGCIFTMFAGAVTVAMAMNRTVPSVAWEDFWIGYPAIQPAPQPELKLPRRPVFDDRARRRMHDSLKQ